MRIKWTFSTEEFSPWCQLQILNYWDGAVQTKSENVSSAFKRFKDKIKRSSKGDDGYVNSGFYQSTSLKEYPPQKH